MPLQSITCCLPISYKSFISPKPQTTAVEQFYRKLLRSFQDLRFLIYDVRRAIRRTYRSVGLKHIVHVAHIVYFFKKLCVLHELCVYKTTSRIVFFADRGSALLYHQTFGCAALGRIYPYQILPRGQRGQGQRCEGSSALG